MNESPLTIRKLLVLAVPTLGQLIAEPLFIMVDTAIVGHVSTQSLAGLSLGSTIVLTAVGLCIFLAYSTTSKVSHLMGAGKMREGMQAGIDGLWLALGIGVVLAVVLFAAAPALCSLLGGNPQDASLGAVYVHTVIVGVPGMLLVYAAQGVFRGLQKMRFLLVVAAGGSLLNCVLDVLFVIVLGFGIAGSGVATAISQWFMCLCLVVPAVRWALAQGALLRPRLEGIAGAGGDGFPLFLRTLALRIGFVATVVVASRIGTDALAAYQVINATWNLALNLLDALAISGQTLVGAELGAGRFKEARSLTTLTAKAGIVMGVVAGLAFIAFGLAAPHLFSPNPVVQHLATVGMVVVGLGLPLQSWMWALDGILIGAGDFRYLAATVAGATAAYLVVLALLGLAVFPRIGDVAVQVGLLWAAFDIVLMGLRALANGLRAAGTAWMK